MFLKRKSISMLLGVVLATQVVGAPVYAKKDKKTGDAGLTDLKYKVGDEKGNEMKALKAEIFIAAQEDKAISQAERLLKKYKGTALEPDLLLRLGELHMRRSKTDRFLEVHRNSEYVVSVAPKAVKSAASRKQVLKAIAIYDQIERRFPRFDKLDVVVFNNAFSNHQIGELQKAEKKYLRLVREFPRSNMIPDGHLALGEISFSRREFKKAITHFQAIRSYPDSLVYPYGMYKAGWTYYNLRDAQAGLKELEDVVKYGRFVKEQGIDARLDLRKEALIDMTLFYEDVRPSKEAYAYFEKQAGELDMSPAVLRLADLYKRHSRHQDVKVILSEFIKRRPTSGHVPMAYVELMDASEKLKKRQDVVTLLSNFNQICSPNSSWAKEQTQESLTQRDSPLSQFADENSKVEQTATVLCGKLFNKMALGYANKWLKHWQKDSSQTDLADATESAFLLYLKSEGETPESARARFVYAELLFKRNKFREASENYALVARLTTDKAMGHDARYFALTALEKAVSDKWSDKDESMFKTLAQNYLSKSPDGKYNLDIEFKIAFIAYEKGRYDEAAPTFLRLGQKYPQQEKGLRAQDLYLDTLNLKKDFVALRDYAFAERNKLKDSERREKLTKIYEEAYFLIIQDLEKRNEWREAVSEYQKFASINPKSNLTQKALWNAMQLLFKGGDMLGASEAALAYNDRYPNTKESLDALMKAAQTYEAMGQLRQAAEVLVRLANVDESQKAKWSLLAADFYVLSGQFGKAKPIYEGLRRSGDALSQQRSLEQLELISRSDKDPRQRESILREVQAAGRQPQASLAAVYFVEKAYAAKDFEEAFNLAKKIIAMEKSGASRSALARARLTQARVLAKEFRDQSVKTQLDRVQLVLTMKTEKLGKAQIAYQSAARYGDPIASVEAYRELADCYLHYSEALRSMPIPRGVPDQEAEVFRAEMDKLAIPMEEKGIETKVLAFQAARELGAADNVVMELQAEMKKLNQTVVKDTRQMRLQPAALVLPNLEGVGS